MSRAETLLSLRDVASTRPGGDLLGPISLSIAKGSWLSLAGPVGAGHSDLVDLIFAQSPLRSGTIRFRGLDMTKAGSQARIEHGLIRCDLGKPLPGFSNLNQWLSVARLLRLDGPKSYLGSIERHLGPGDRSDIHSVLEFTELRELADQPLDRLNLEEKRLALLACALVQSPHLIVVERAFSRLPQERLKLWAARFRKLCSQGISLFVIDDCPGFLAEHSDQLAIMAQGRILAQGDPDTVGVDPFAIEALTGRPHLR